MTSAFSAQLIAVSSIVTYDIYQSVPLRVGCLTAGSLTKRPRTYINPSAPGKRLIVVSHTSVCAYGVIMAGFSVGLYHAGISMGWLYVSTTYLNTEKRSPVLLTRHSSGWAS